VSGKNGWKIFSPLGTHKRNTKEAFQVKNITIYNTLKGRLDTVYFEFTPENTTWFDDVEDYDIYRIADAIDGILI
jgi:hypothetical protein